MDAFLGETSLAQAMPRELYDELMRMYQAGSCAMFESDQLASSFARHLRGWPPGSAGASASAHQCTLMGTGSAHEAAP